MSKWIISDTHFYHEMLVTNGLISKMAKRDFKSVEQMNDRMFRKWLNVVKPTDTIYHLGDFSFGNSQQTSDMLLALPGQKVLIVGNHDKSAERMVELGFDFTCQSMIVAVAGRLVMLNHRPLAELPNYKDPEYPRGIELVIHGHIHNTSWEDRMQANMRHQNDWELIDIPKFNVNVSVEVTGYAPLSLWSVVNNKLNCKHNLSA
jgi:calcineurin-like phosphoesterase family protein